MSTIKVVMEWKIRLDYTLLRKLGKLIEFCKLTARTLHDIAPKVMVLSNIKTKTTLR